MIANYKYDMWAHVHDVSISQRYSSHLYFILMYYVRFVDHCLSFFDLHPIIPQFVC